MARTKDNVKKLAPLLEKVKGNRSRAQFARDLDVSPQYLSNVFRGNVPASDKFLAKVGIKRNVEVRVNYEVFPAAKRRAE